MLLVKLVPYEAILPCYSSMVWVFLQLKLPQIQKIMMEFEKQSEIMDMKEEMMNDAIDDAMGDEDDEEESLAFSLYLVYSFAWFNTVLFLKLLKYLILRKRKKYCRFLQTLNNVALFLSSKNNEEYRPSVLSHPALRDLENYSCSRKLWSS